MLEMNNFVLLPFQSFDCLEIKQSFLCERFLTWMVFIKISNMLYGGKF